MAEKKKKLYAADLELTRINKDTLRYRVINANGIGCALSHIEFDRSGFPDDDDFNMSFINAEIDKSDKANRDKQAKFREYVNYKLVIE